ncbi:sensor histidine kinase [Streptococcus gallinaceus]|uniref:histidine kinase n=1 Tax=Streptococcus gallinaceus TaxID=165758 RepID=A0ABV2JHR4_9STRE
MTRREWWQFLWNWLRERALFLIGFALLSFLLWAFSGLYGIEQGVADYGFLLILVIMLLVFLMDGVRQFRKWSAVLAGQDFPHQTAIEMFLLKKYQEAALQLASCKAEERARQEDLQDYYTMWAHQMKVPIAASQLLIGDLDASQHKQELSQELLKIEQYTGLVLNYLRLQSFHDDLVFRKENLADLVNQTVKKFSIFFIQQRIRLELGDLEQEIVTDKRWFGLLLEQFLSNALKYTKTGTISILLDEGDLVIRDTGIGIAKEDLERVFERGFSGYNGRITQQSSGLGLYLSRKIAQELDFSLKLTSEVGKGTEVRIGINQKRLRLD